MKKILLILLIFISTIGYGQCEIPDDFEQQKQDEYNQLDEHEKEKISWLDYWLNAQIEFCRLKHLDSFPNEVYDPWGNSELDPRSATNPCENGNFEMTNPFQDWTGAWARYDGNGYLENPITNRFHTHSNPDFQRHLIVGAGTDPKVGISRIPINGGSSAIRIGDLNVGQEADLISKRFLVSQANSLITFWYAVVLEYHGIMANRFQQAGFTVRVTVRNNNGTITDISNSVNIGNGTNNVHVDGVNDPFLNNFTHPGQVPLRDDIVFRDWSCATIDLSNHVGNEVLIEFISNNCNQGAHFGYAYLDNFCGTCSENNFSASLGSAPKCGPGIVNVNYILPFLTSGRYTSDVTLTLKTSQNGTLTPFTKTSGKLTSGTSYPFTLSAAELGTLSGSKFFDYWIEADFTLNGVNVGKQFVGNPISGQVANNNNDYEIICGAAPSDCPDECYWKLNGNDITPRPNSFIGTIKSHPFVMKTFATERMRITEDGNVGIGITDPTFGNLVGPKVAISQADNFSALCVGNATTPRFSLNTRTNGSWTLQDYVNNTWNAGITQVAGSVGINTQTPTERLDVLNGEISARRNNTANPNTHSSDVNSAIISSEGAIELYRTSPSINGFIDFKNAWNTDYNGRLAFRSNFQRIVPNTFNQGFSFDLENLGELVSIINNSSDPNHGGIMGRVGIGNQNPGNKLEIRAENMNTSFQDDNTGKSGLRFRNLTMKAPSFTIPQTNKVLSVNSDGDVILVEAIGAINGAENGCSIENKKVVFGHKGGTGSGGNLLSDREIPMDSLSIHFLNNLGSNRNSISIGYDNYYTSEGEKVGTFNVLNTTINDNLGLTESGVRLTRNNRIGIYTKSNRNETQDDINVYGVFAEASNSNFCLKGRKSIGVNGIAHNGELGIGVRGEAISVSDCPNREAFGGSFISTSMRNKLNIGVKADAENGLLNYGIYADGGLRDALRNGVATNDYAGFFNGDVYTTSTFQASDKNLKEDIKEIQNSSDLISKLVPYTYKYKANTGLSLPEVDQFGFIAQDVEKIFPTLVRTAIIPNSKENQQIKVVNYQGFIPLLWKAHQELAAVVEKQNNAVIENDALKSELARVNEKLANYDEKFALLEKSIAALCENGCGGLKDLGAKTSSEVDVLYQSIPNPTDDIALINYFLTKEYKDATISVSTQDGKQIQSFKLEPKQGAGSVKVSLGTLASGTYLYTLVAGERIVDTKRLQIVK